MTLEPFGLFNLLKSVLSAMPQTEGNPQSPPDSSPHHNDQATEGNLKENERVSTPSAPPVPPQAPQPHQNACLDFLEAHERRAKRKK